MGLYVTITNDDERECAVVGVTKHHETDGVKFASEEVKLAGGESQRFVVRDDGSLELSVRAVHVPVPCWC